MTEQITLLDVCKLPDVQIHSKSGLFKYLVNRQNGEMLKLRQNIVRLSYTNKIIGVRGDEVGIISKRLPLKFISKQVGRKQPVDKKVEECFLQDAGFIAHRNFYVQPLPTVKKSNSQQKIVQEKLLTKHVNGKVQSNLDSKNTLTLDTQNGIILYQEQNYKPTTSFRSRTQSMARLKIYEKKQSNKDTQIKFKINSSRFDQRKKKSFSNLLKDIKSDHLNRNMVVAPILHQQSNLYKRYQRLSQKEADRKKTDQNQKKLKYSEQSPEKRLKKRLERGNAGNQLQKYKKSEEQILVEADD